MSSALSTSAAMRKYVAAILATGVALSLAFLLLLAFRFVTGRGLGFGLWRVKHLGLAVLNRDEVTATSNGDYTNVIFLHHSTGNNLIEQGGVRELFPAAQDAAFAIVQQVRDNLPRHILMSNSFCGWWVDSFWTDPKRAHLMDYSDKHWYANESGSGCDEQGENCKLISNVWDDSAAYVRECARRFDEYRDAYDYDKPIVRGEDGVAVSATEPQHPNIARDPAGTYYHKKLWAHLGVLGDTCDGEWYPRLFVESGAFPSPGRNLYRMFAAYERFIAGERLSSGAWVEMGSDLTGDQHITVSDGGGDLRAWGVQDTASGRTLLWVDNAADTWKAPLDGAEVAPASGTLQIGGLAPGQAYVVQWWDPYASGSTRPGLDLESLGAVRADGSALLAIEDLSRDVTLKVFEMEPCYLPLAVRATTG